MALFGDNGIISSIGKAVDDNVTSDEERGKIKAQLLSLENEFDKEITERWKADGKDGGLTRIMRPLSYLVMMTLFIFIVLTDGNIEGFNVKSGYLTILETIIITMTIAYFGGRSFEKFGRHVGKKL